MGRLKEYAKFRLPFKLRLRHKKPRLINMTRAFDQINRSTAWEKFRR